jgi:uncharacterized Zn finger protein
VVLEKAKCPNRECRCPYWAGLKEVSVAYRPPGLRPEKKMAGFLVECVRCGTVYSIVTEGVIKAPAVAQPTQNVAQPEPAEDDDPVVNFDDENMEDGEE